MDTIYARMRRVTEDLRIIQQELNFAAIQASANVEQGEANELPTGEALNTLRAALDQMRHFLWFYSQIMSNGSGLKETLRRALQQGSGEEAAAPTDAPPEKLRSAADKAFLRYRLNGKKPN